MDKGDEEISGWVSCCVFNPNDTKDYAKLLNKKSHAEYNIQSRWFSNPSLIKSLEQP